MKRFLLLGLLLTVMLGATMFTASAQANDYPTVVTIPGYLRGGPGVEFESYGVLRAGALFRVDGRNFNGNWLRGITERGTIGWLDSGSVNITWDELIGLVIVTTNDPFLLSAPVAGDVPPPAAAPAAPADDADAADAVTDDTATASEEAPLPATNGALLPNLDPNYSGGIPNGELINPYQGDHAVRLYPLLDGNGNRFLHVYRIALNQGWHIMTISPDDVAAFTNNLPSTPLLLKYEAGDMGRYGPAYLYLLPDGNLRFVIGPDDEDRQQVLTFSGPDALSLVDYYVNVIPGGWTGSRPGPN